MADDLDAPLRLLRTAADDVHPSDTLRGAVLDGLPDRAARAARPALVPLALAAGLAVAAGGLVAAWPRGAREDPPPTPRAAAPAAPDADARAAAQARARAENRAIYDAQRAQWPAGTWVSIAWRDPATVEGAYKPVVLGTSFESVAAAGAEAAHRYVFRVGEEGDVESFVSSWYAPRFAGAPFVTALGIESWQGGEDVVLVKGERKVRFAGPTPFPRVRATIAPPDGTPPRRTGDAAPELWFGSVGPTLMLTPEDAEELGLARFEVPGTEAVGGVPCRRVRVTVAVPGLDAQATVVGAVPDVPYARLVAASRARHRFWAWDAGLRAALQLAPPVLSAVPMPPTWVVFGNDRVLGRGGSPETALADADRFSDVVYHRYVLRWPRPAAPEVADPGPVAATVELPGGVVVEATLPAGWFDAARAPDDAAARPAVVTVHVARMTEAQWVRAGLHRAELGEDLLLDHNEADPAEPAAPPAVESDTRAAFARVRLRPAGATAPEQEAFARLWAHVTP